MIKRMTLNNVPINLDKLGAKCKGKTVMGSEYTPITVKAQQSLVYKHIRTDREPYNMQLDFIIRRDSTQELWESILTLSNIHACEIVFSNHNFVYDCTLVQATPQLLNPQKALLSLVYRCEIYSPEETITISQNPQTVIIRGAQPTYINIEVTALENLTDFAVNDINIKSLANGETLTINSFDRIADMSVIDMTSFPQGLGPYQVVTDITKAIVKLKYRARW